MTIPKTSTIPLIQSIPMIAYSYAPITHVNAPLVAMNLLTFEGSALIEEGSVSRLHFLTNGTTVLVYKYISQLSYKKPLLRTEYTSTTSTRIHTMYRVALESAKGTLDLAFLDRLGEAGIRTDKYLGELEVVDYLNTLQNVPSVGDIQCI